MVDSEQHNPARRIYCKHRGESPRSFRKAENYSPWLNGHKIVPPTPSQRKSPPTESM